MFIDLRKQRCRGVTIAELWIGIAVSGIVLASLLAFTLYAGKSFAALTNYVDLEQKSQKALDTMTREIRQTDKLLSYTTTTLKGQTITNSLTFLDSDGKTLSYTYDVGGTLTRSKDGISTMLLTNCDFLTFMIYNRTPVSGAFEQYPAGTADLCKLISVSWICSRSILGTRLNTESVQTAKIVIRKQ